MSWRAPLSSALTARWDLPLVAVRPHWGLSQIPEEDILVRGRERFSPSGTSYEVAYWGELRPGLRQALGTLLAPGGSLKRRSTILGPFTPDEYERIGIISNELSAQNALAATACVMDLPYSVTGSGVHVDGVDPDGPNTWLRPGDVIRSLNGSPLAILEDFLPLPEGDLVVDVALTTLFPGEERTSPGVLTRSASGTLGLQVSTHHRHVTAGLDVDVVTSSDAGGPSAGLATALRLLDLLQGQVLHGLRVCSTGEITPSGRVKPIGGVEMKTRVVLDHNGVDLFLVPEENFEAAAGVARGRVKVLGVPSLQAALALLPLHA